MSFISARAPFFVVVVLNSLVLFLLLTAQGLAKKPFPTKPLSGLQTDQGYAIVLGHSSLLSLTSEPLGYIAADLPWKVGQGETFRVDIWLSSKNHPNGPVTVYMEQTDLMEYEPREVKILPGRRATLKARVLKSGSGLSQVIATADGWIPLAVSIDSGFHSALAESMPNQIYSGTTESFALKILGEDGKPLSLDAPASIIIESSFAEIRSGNKPWSNTLELLLERGANSSPIVEIRPTALPPSRGFIKSDLRINSQQIIRSSTHEFQILPSWWLALSMAALGGAAWSTFDLFRTRSVGRLSLGRSIGSLTTGLAAGCLSYLLASWEVLGIKVDTTSLRGFLILGIVFSYIGVDAVMKKVSTHIKP